MSVEKRWADKQTYDKFVANYTFIEGCDETLIRQLCLIACIQFAYLFFIVLYNRNENGIGIVCSSVAWKQIQL